MGRYQNLHISGTCLIASDSLAACYLFTLLAASFYLYFHYLL